MPDYRNSSACMSDMDGECSWRKCPQIQDDEPRKSGRHCPLDYITPEKYTEEEAKILIDGIINEKTSSIEPNN